MPVCCICELLTFVGSFINSWFAVTLPTVEILAPDKFDVVEILPIAVIVPDEAIVSACKLPVSSIDAYVIAPAVIWFWTKNPF